MNKKLLAVAIASAMAAPMAANAIEASVSGHVNRLIFFGDDGFDSDVVQADSAQSASRFRITGSSDLGIGGMKVGVNLETAWASNVSSNITLKGRNGNDTATDGAFNIRHSNLWFGGGWGRLLVGHTSTAYDGIADATLAGPVFLAGVANGATMGTALVFKRTGNATVQIQQGGQNANLTAGTSYRSFDGNHRDVLRYDTPSFGPLSARVSVGDNQTWQASARLSSTFSGAQIQITGGYEDLENDAEDARDAAGAPTVQTSEQWGMTGSILLSQGTNFSVQYSGGDLIRGNGNGANGNAGRDVGDGRTLSLILGHRWGANAIAAQYGNHDFDGETASNSTDYDTTIWGIGFVHTLSEPRVELYAGYRNMDTDVQGVGGIEDIDMFQMGARVRF